MSSTVFVILLVLAVIFTVCCWGVTTVCQNIVDALNNLSDNVHAKMVLDETNHRFNDKLIALSKRINDVIDIGVKTDVRSVEYQKTFKTHLFELSEALKKDVGDLEKNVIKDVTDIHENLAGKTKLIDKLSDNEKRWLEQFKYQNEGIQTIRNRLDILTRNVDIQKVQVAGLLKKQRVKKK